MIDIEYNRTSTDLLAVAALLVEAAHRARDGEREVTQERIAPAVGTRGAALGTCNEHCRPQPAGAQALLHCRVIHMS